MSPLRVLAAIPLAITADICNAGVERLIGPADPFSNYRIDIGTLSNEQLDDIFGDD